MTKVTFIDLGYKKYYDTWVYQNKLFNSIKKYKHNKKYIQENITTNNYLLFTEHPHVYTMGKSGKNEHILFDKNFLKKNNIDFYNIDRGGSITYHGPGQLVIYPILNLDYFFKDINIYLRLLEDLIIKTIFDFGIIGTRSNGETGVWINDAKKNKYKKICAIGIRVSNWTTMHGLALNINTNLKYFEYINPCGISKGVTSIAYEKNKYIDIKKVKLIIKNIFQKIFNVILI